MNIDIEVEYFSKGIEMPLDKIKDVYSGEMIYKRMLLDIIYNIYKPKNKIMVCNDIRVYNEERIAKRSKIYKIVSKNTDKIYIGSTIFNLDYRMSKHMEDYNFYNEYKKNYISSIEILKYGENDIILLEEVDNELRIDTESKYINDNIEKVVNIIDPKTNRKIRDIKYETKNRKEEFNKFIIKYVIKKIKDECINIECMEDMYKIYMELKNGINKMIFDKNKKYYKEGVI